MFLAQKRPNALISVDSNKVEEISREVVPEKTELLVTSVRINIHTSRSLNTLERLKRKFHKGKSRVLSKTVRE
ncbi:MAG TPA: hypothetical protein V6D50_23895 [Chroococcales cyanobacterium]|jgi:hypothetical protein